MRILWREKCCSLFNSERCDSRIRFFATYLAVSAIDVDGPTDIVMTGAVVIAGLILLAGALRALVSLKDSGNDNKGVEGN